MLGFLFAVGFSQYFDVVGYDLNESRINQVASGFDSTFETQREQLVANQKLRFTNRIADLADCNCYIVTVSQRRLINGTDQICPRLNKQAMSWPSLFLQET